MSKDRKRLGPRPETLVRRRKILKASMEVFGNKGYAGGTLAEIAEQVGMTHAGILHHFGSKDQLLFEVLSYRDESDVENFETKHMPDGMGLFRHLVRTAFSNAQRAGIVQAYVVLSAESVTDGHPARAYFERRYTTLRQETGAAFEKVCAERDIESPATVARASAAILAVMDGLQVQWMLDPTLDLAESSQFAIEAIVSAVLGSPVDLSPSATDHETTRTP